MPSRCRASYRLKCCYGKKHYGCPPQIKWCSQCEFQKKLLKRTTAAATAAAAEVAARGGKGSTPAAQRVKKAKSVASKSSPKRKPPPAASAATDDSIVAPIPLAKANARPVGTREHVQLDTCQDCLRELAKVHASGRASGGVGAVRLCPCCTQTVGKIENFVRKLLVRARRQTPPLPVVLLATSIGPRRVSGRRTRKVTQHSPANTVHSRVRSLCRRQTTP